LPGLAFPGLTLSGACVSADAATLFAAFDDLGLERIFEAFEATLLDVFSFFAIFYLHG
jgi:hypothetical protein